jgi:hypothetical protein
MIHLLSGDGLRYNEETTAPGAQTERRGGARPVSVLRRGWYSPAASFQEAVVIELPGFSQIRYIFTGDAHFKRVNLGFRLFP